MMKIIDYNKYELTVDTVLLNIQSLAGFLKKDDESLQM